MDDPILVYRFLDAKGHAEWGNIAPQNYDTPLVSFRVFLAVYQCLVVGILTTDAMLFPVKALEYHSNSSSAIGLQDHCLENVSQYFQSPKKLLTVL